MEQLQQYTMFVEVILPLSLNKQYTYAVPNDLELQIAIGKRVEIQFGKNKLYAAIISKISNFAPKDYIAKPILSVLDTELIVTQNQLNLWFWMANYYMCNLGDVMNAALPAYYKLDSETFFIKNPLSETNILDLEDEEYLIAAAFEFQAELSLNDITKILSKKTVGKHIKNLLDKQIIVLKENLENKYKPKIETFVKLLMDKNNIKTAFDLVAKYPKQEQVLLAFLELSKNNLEVKKSDLLKRANVSISSLQTLIKNNIFELYDKIVDRISATEIKILQEYILSEHQQNVYNNLLLQMQQKQVCLLQGVTSSGKTLLYINLIKEQLKNQKQILFLVPEIALTTQLIQRLKIALGNVGVYHSKFNNAERIETWNKVKNNEYKIIIGARSSIFLPFNNLGLIIIDEEHDTSYKQKEPNPHYQARDTAIYLATLHNAKVILGSATPSIETYHNVQLEKYGLAILEKRFGNMEMPILEFVDLSKARKNKELNNGISLQLKNEIEQVLKKNKQVILFQNRRGYAPYIECNDCNWIPMCKNCDVTLTYHKFTNDLRCHYCGFTQTNLHQCKACNNNNLQQKGLGTERIEDDIQAMFPLAKVGRMDYDTVKTKKGHEKIIDLFTNHEIDILIGTQMVTKGLDFDNVSLVGVINADSLLYYPDFRATEFAYQLLTQVSGRAGRKNDIGKVQIQMSNVQHPIVNLLQKKYDYFFEKELLERQIHNYPPFCRLILITLKHKDIKALIDGANFFVEQLKQKNDYQILGPSQPTIQKINNFFIREILIKIPKNQTTITTTKHYILFCKQQLFQYEKYKNIRINFDVDCY